MAWHLNGTRAFVTLSAVDLFDMILCELYHY